MCLIVEKSGEGGWQIYLMAEPSGTSEDKSCKEAQWLGELTNFETLIILLKFSQSLILFNHPPYDEWVNIKVHYYDLDLFTFPLQSNTPLGQLHPPSDGCPTEREESLQHQGVSILQTSRYTSLDSIFFGDMRFQGSKN